MEANDKTVKLYYNTELDKLRMPEYGRNIWSMVEELKAIPDRAKRSEQARAVVKSMEILNPQVHSQDNYEQKLWDHLFMIADYDLDIDAPYPMPQPEERLARPMVIPLKRHRADVRVPDPCPRGPGALEDLLRFEFRPSRPQPQHGAGRRPQEPAEERAEAQVIY